MKTFAKTLLATAATLAAAASHATILTTFDSIPAGAATFDSIVQATGATVQTGKIGGAGFTVTRNNGGSIWTSTYGTMTGPVVSIDPYGRTPGIGGLASGVTLTFASAVNSVGFEVGDWGTCCRPSALFISFDDGAPIQVGISLKPNDVQFNGKDEVFVAAYDDSGSFKKVQFWGDGYGEILWFGGTFRYANVEGGTLPPVNAAVPEPATYAMFGIAGLALAGIARRRRQQS